MNVGTYKISNKKFVSQGIPKKVPLKSLSGGHNLVEKGPVRVFSKNFGIWTEDMSVQVNNEKTLQEREQERKRLAAIAAMKLDEQRKLASEYQNLNMISY